MPVKVTRIKPPLQITNVTPQLWALAAIVSPVASLRAPSFYGIFMAQSWRFNDPAKSPVRV